MDRHVVSVFQNPTDSVGVVQSGYHHQFWRFCYKYTLSCWKTWIHARVGSHGCNLSSNIKVATLYSYTFLSFKILFTVESCSTSGKALFLSRKKIYLVTLFCKILQQLFWIYWSVAVFTKFRENSKWTIRVLIYTCFFTMHMHRLQKRENNPIS